LAVTTPDAGDDSIDSDFDDSPCSYDIILNGKQIVERDLGLVGTTINPDQPTDPVNPDTPQIDNQIVAGFIWLDENEDGLQTPGEPGIAGVRVSYGKKANKHVETDESGHYLINGVESGSQRICVFQRYPNLLTLTSKDAGDDALDSDFDNENLCTTVQLEVNQQIDVDMGVIGYDENNRPGVVVTAPFHPESAPFYNGYVWEDSGPILHILDGEDKGLAGIEIIAIDRENPALEQNSYLLISSVLEDSIIARTNTDENGYFEFSNLQPSSRYRFYARFIDDTYKTMRGSTLHSLSMHFINLGSVYHGSHLDRDSEFGVYLGDRRFSSNRNMSLALIKKNQPKPSGVVIQLRGGKDTIADGILATQGIESTYAATNGGFSREYIVYDEQMRAIMSSTRHTGSESIRLMLDFFPVDAAREYTICSPGDDISSYIPHTGISSFFGVGIFNEFNPATGCTQPLQLQSSRAQVYLLVKTELPEKLFGSVWLDRGEEKLERAPAVEFTVYRADSEEAVATARSGIAKPGHGISGTRSTPDDSDLVYFPDDLAPGDYFVCANTAFKQNGFKISPLSTFNVETGCTDIFRFPEQRQSHTPSLILEQV
jgi:hypothetical protein